MLILHSKELLVRLDPAHGAELLDLTDMRTGRQLLARPPFRAEDPVPGDLAEDAWNASYRGGWQLAAPNVCNACSVEGTRHGYHGAASVDPWYVLDYAQAHATITWSGHGMEMVRHFELAGDRLRIETEARAAAGRVPMIALEHCTLGLDVLDPEVELKLPRAVAYDVSQTDGPLTAPVHAAQWPHVLLRTGATEDASTWPITQPRSRWFVLSDVAEGAAAAINRRHGGGLELRWDTRSLPHLHVWHEAGGAGGVWRGRGYLLGLEPSTVPHGLGLAEAIDAGQARWLEPEKPFRWWVSARVLP